MTTEGEVVLADMITLQELGVMPPTGTEKQMVGVYRTSPEMEEGQLYFLEQLRENDYRGVVLEHSGRQGFTDVSAVGKYMGGRAITPKNVYLSLDNGSVKARGDLVWARQFAGNVATLVEELPHDKLAEAIQGSYGYHSSIFMAGASILRSFAEGESEISIATPIIYDGTEYGFPQVLGDMPK